MKLTEAIAFRIRKLLKENNMTLYALEKSTALSHSTMTDLMSAKYSTPSFKNIMLIIRVLNVKTSEFFDDPIFENDNLIID